MKSFIKPTVLILLVIILVTVVCLPPKVSAISYYPGFKTKINQIDTCICPSIATVDCQCGFLEPPIF